ncbi:hypothetical protein [Larkinella rosea]|uniref:Uncharacterized protein n=1 Tax=Larkinella rosea TaxID=2025312 RepID=A0A3P1BNE2_9BACT|nr:hypothetical protein [Larkinella rosea]RRB01994.1 hypothetical protein EHT25_15975 [Larkinella rosea]
MSMTTAQNVTPFTFLAIKVGLTLFANSVFHPYGKRKIWLHGPKSTNTAARKSGKERSVMWNGGR